jgi:hypothetical protein
MGSARIRGASPSIELGDSDSQADIAVRLGGRSDAIERATLEQARAGLTERLRSRRTEIEEAVLNRVYAIADPGEVKDPTYVAGLKGALSAALDYGLEGLELGEEHAPQIPIAVLAQARMAARNGVSLDTVLRRYFAGYGVLDDFLIEEAGLDAPATSAGLKRLLRSCADLFDRLVVAVSEEYRREAELRPSSSEQRRVRRIERLLSGERRDTSGLDYELQAHHVALIARGSATRNAIRDLASAIDHRLLLVEPEEGTAWAWFGGRQPIDAADLKRRLSSTFSEKTVVAIGEPTEGLAGWRFSHRQAAAALAVAQRMNPPVTRYADVALVASIVNDDLLTASLHRIYLAPLAQERDGGTAARQTLRAYIDAKQNITSAAAALGVNRNTVASRLHTIEQIVGRPLASCIADLRVVLSLDELTQWSDSFTNTAVS